MDVDSTLIEQEVIELIAAFAGTQELVKEVTESAMRGEIDFKESLKRRVATLAGVDQASLAEIRKQITFSPGAPELVKAIQDRGWSVALISGGFTEIVSVLAAELNIPLFQANQLAVIDGKLSGETVGQVVDRAYKAQALQAFAEQLDIPLSQTVAIGDGANDLDMIAKAKIGIAYRAKPIVQEVAPYNIDHLPQALEIVLDYLN